MSKSLPKHNLRIEWIKDVKSKGAYWSLPAGSAFVVHTTFVPGPLSTNVTTPMPFRIWTFTKPHAPM